MFLKSFTQRSIRNHHFRSIVNPQKNAILASKRYNQTSTSVEKTNVPSLEIAKSMETSYERMDNQSLVVLSHMESPPITAARAEVLKRHIMSVDEVDYPTATEIFAAIEKKNNESASLLALPYKLAIFTATGAGLASFPLCFNLDIAKWFNTHYVTTDVPGVEDLETMLEVGAWTWNWMEPPLGQISFFLLCLQFSRAQIQNLGIQPYTERVKSMRASELSSAFPKYDKNIIKAFSESNGIDKQR